MITASGALKALHRHGLIDGWDMARGGSFDRCCTYTSFHVSKGTGPLKYFGQETYGKKSYLYFTWKNKDKAQRAARILRKAGGSPSFTWSPEEHESFELRVSPYKGWQWWV